MKESQEKGTPPTIGMGVYGEAHPVTDDSDEAARIVGLDFAVNTLINKRGEHCAVYAGEFHEVHQAAIAEAKTHYATEMPADADIVVANAFYKANENLIALFAAPSALKHSGGDFVLINNCPEGQVPHYYAGPWGKFLRGVGATPSSIAPFVNHLINFNKYPFPGSFWPVTPEEKLTNLHRWDDVIAALKKWHGEKAKVVVFPDATIQMFPTSGKPRHHAGTAAH
jgi:nickel-dependent lactate racemase